MTEDYTRPNRELELCHPLVRERWPRLDTCLLHRYGWRMLLTEGYRPELRQQWLYGQGRSVGQLAEKGIAARFARPALPRVTNAWSARFSAHGFTLRGPDGPIPAAAAIDVVPLGADGRPFTRDDPWEEFVRAIAVEGPRHGLVHFHSPGKGVWDKPHLELLEWSNRLHTVTDRKDPHD